MKTKLHFHRVCLISMVLSVAFIMTGQAQEQFRLSDYKNPAYHWKMIDVGFDLSGSNYHETYNRESGDSTKGLRYQFGGGLTTVYRNYRNSVHYQGTQYLNFKGSLSAGSTSGDGWWGSAEDKRWDNDQDIYLRIISENRFYNNKKQFFEVNYDISGRILHNLNKYSSEEEELPFTDKTTYVRYDSYGSVGILLGTGRIEDVQDARLAVYILDDLMTGGDLTRKATAAETLEFAELITQLKNQRFFDSRIRRIQDITAIDSFLTVKGLRAESDASYFTTIYDDWDYAAGPVRATGGRFSFGVMPSTGYSHTNSKVFYRDTSGNAGVIENYFDESIGSSISWGLDGIVAYTWEKPVNLFWQHSINTDAGYALFHQKLKHKYYYQENLKSESENLFNTPNLWVNFDYKLGFYPNSRTHIVLGVSSSYLQYWGDKTYDEAEPLEIDRKVLLSGANLSCYYYLSPQLRLQVIVSASHSFNMEKDYVSDTERVTVKQGVMNMTYYANLTYSIF